VAENEAPKVDEPAPKKRRKPGRQKGDASPQAEVERQEHIKEAMEYRLMGYTYRQIAEQMDAAPSTVYKWIFGRPGRDHAGDRRGACRVMMEQCPSDHPEAKPLMDETAPKDILDGILRVQQQQIKLADLLQGNGGTSVSIGKPGEGNTDENIVLRIKADAPALKPDEPVPANPVL
jgi:Putative ATPase subunit of terminase (gpP-like)